MVSGTGTEDLARTCRGPATVPYLARVVSASFCDGLVRISRIHREAFRELT